MVQVRACGRVVQCDAITTAGWGNEPGKCQGDAEKTAGGLDVVHLFFVRGVFKDFLEGHTLSLGLKRPLEPGPDGPEFWRTLRIAQRRGIKDLPVDRAKDVRHGDIGGRFGEEVTAFLAPLAANQAFCLQFDENLNQVIRRNALLRSEVLRPDAFILMIMTREPEDSPGRVITFDR